MAATFFFYDLETSGFNPRTARIMQFAGQRTDMNLKPIGEPYNILVKLTEDVLPDPEAVLVTGITPQKTLAEGIAEAEFVQLFAAEIDKPETTFVGFNSIRFDDEFMRFLFYRNFYDPYAWEWKNGSSRWDLLDVVRMTRALRPEGIKWPKAADGKNTNRLELLTEMNRLDHSYAHDALSDVRATMAVAQMIKSKHPKLFDWLYSIRSKQAVTTEIKKGQPFIYTSGRYPSEFEKTTVVTVLGVHPTSQGALVYDLRHDPEPFLKMSPQELAEAWRYDPEADSPRLPVKSLQFNRSPAIAPLGVLDDAGWKRLQLNLKEIEANRTKLTADKNFYDRVSQAVEKMNIERDKKAALHIKGEARIPEVDELLYDKFIPDMDRITSDKLRKAKPEEVGDFAGKFKDSRLKHLTALYKARNHPSSLTDEERKTWEEHRERVLFSGGTASRLTQYVGKLSELSQTAKDANAQYLLEELRLYAESIAPES